MEPGNICMASDSGGDRGWRRRVEIRLSPGFSVCQGQVSAVKSRENSRCPFRTSSGGTTAPMRGEEKHHHAPSPAQPLLSSHSPGRGMVQVVLPTPLPQLYTAMLLPVCASCASLSGVPTNLNHSICIRSCRASPHPVLWEEQAPQEHRSALG